MKALFNFLNGCLKVKEWWKFYGILMFLSFLAYLLFGGGLGHFGQLKDLIQNEQIEVKSDAVE